MDTNRFGIREPSKSFDNCSEERLVDWKLEIRRPNLSLDSGNSREAVVLLQWSKDFENSKSGIRDLNATGDQVKQFETNWNNSKLVQKLGVEVRWSNFGVLESKIWIEIFKIRSDHAVEAVFSPALASETSYH